MLLRCAQTLDGRGGRGPTDAGAGADGRRTGAGAGPQSRVIARLTQYITFITVSLFVENLLANNFKR